jgi:hypothetical protein
MTSIPSLKCHTENEFWQLVVAIETTPAFCAASSSLKTIASAVLLDRQPLDRIVRWRKVLAMRIGRPQVFSVLGREVVERQ